MTIFHLRSNVRIDVGLNVEAEVRLGPMMDLCPVIFVHPRGAGIIPDNVVCFIENKDSLHDAGPIGPVFPIEPGKVDTMRDVESSG